MSTAIDRFDDKARESFEHVGRTEIYPGELLRHPVYTRVLHWTVAGFFFLAAFSGFALYLPWLYHWLTPIFGGGATTRMLHPYFGLGFVFFLFLQLLNWLVPMTWCPADTKWIGNISRIASGKEILEPLETGFFNAGQKALFWEIIVGSAVYVITGIILWAGTRTFGALAVSISYVLHDLSAMIMLGGIFIHIYLSTIGEPGTLQAMIRGAVSEAWAWTFHPAWYKKVTGRDPRQAYEEAVRRRDEALRRENETPQKTS